MPSAKTTAHKLAELERAYKFFTRKIDALNRELDMYMRDFSKEIDRVQIGAIQKRLGRMK